LLLAVVGVLVIKAIVTATLLRLEGARKAVAAETGVLMASPSETTLIVLAAASAAQLIRPETAAFWQIVTAIGLTVTPLLAKLGRVAARRMDKPSELDLTAVGTGEARPRVVVIGFGRVGRLVADMLASHDKSYVAVDSDSIPSPQRGPRAIRSSSGTFRGPSSSTA
jgi:CPA2 family monovalent cation:H+ antiporter-2